MTFFLIFAPAIILIILPAVASAYLDPGTGSFILQILLASLFGASFAVKTFWRRIRIFLANLFKRAPAKEKENDT